MSWSLLDCGCEIDVQRFGTQITLCADHVWMLDKPQPPNVATFGANHPTAADQHGDSVRS